MSPPNHFIRLRRFVFAALLLLSIIAILRPHSAKASVTLVSFTVIEETGWARLDWETATEIDNAGFRIRRNNSGGTDPNNYSPPITVVNVSSGEETNFVPPEGDLIGALYAYYDKNVVPGTTYYYLLESINSLNVSEYYGPVFLTMSGTGPTPTPSATPSATQSPTPTASPTTGSITPTSTPTATVIGTVTPTRTPTRTSTPFPTAPPTRPPLFTVTPTRTHTPTPGPSSTLTLTPSITPSPSLTLHPLDLTLTAVMAQVTSAPTITPRLPTKTPFPTYTLAVPPTPTLQFFEGANSTGTLGITITLLVLIGSGGLLTLFLILFTRDRSQEDSQ